MNHTTPENFFFLEFSLINPVVIINKIVVVPP